MKKRLLVFSLCIAAVATVFLSRKENTAKIAEFSVEVNDQKVKKGSEFTVYVNVNSSVELGKINADLEYDAASLEFVKADNTAVVGTDGTLYINEEFETPVTNMKYALTMRALEVGTSELVIKDVYLEDSMNTDVIEVSQTSSKIEVIKNSEEESDTALSELMVFPGTLNPSFDQKVKEYEVTVDSDVDELILSAVPSLESSVVTIDQPEVLKPGVNDVTIAVTAPSGNVSNYRIKVFRSK